MANESNYRFIVNGKTPEQVYACQTSTQPSIEAQRAATAIHYYRQAVGGGTWDANNEVAKIVDKAIVEFISNMNNNKERQYEKRSQA